MQYLELLIVTLLTGLANMLVQRFMKDQAVKDDVATTIGSGAVLGLVALLSNFLVLPMLGMNPVVGF